MVMVATYFVTEKICFRMNIIVIEWMPLIHFVSQPPSTETVSRRSGPDLKQPGHLQAQDSGQKLAMATIYEESKVKENTSVWCSSQFQPHGNIGKMIPFRD